MRSRITSPNTAQAAGQEDPAGRPDALASRPGADRPVPADGALAPLKAKPAPKAQQAEPNTERRVSLPAVPGRLPLASPPSAVLASSRPAATAQARLDALEPALVQLLGSTNGHASHLAERLEVLTRLVEKGVSQVELSDVLDRTDAILESAIEFERAEIIDKAQCRDITDYVTALRQKAEE
ncbi:hypothetical protein BER2_0643 [plant metagenome]|uniref:Uncharacterized protein n=1 Tax=plant metagenome TaxID=1297885 RepID=A0A484SW61_9ZZZZ